MSYRSIQQEVLVYFIVAQTQKTGRDWVPISYRRTHYFLPLSSIPQKFYR